jgi:DNA-directed RNA polymerase specialized sigma24 family protein
MKRGLTKSRRAGPGNWSEAEAVRVAQRGGAAGFERLYELHGRQVHALCLRMVGNAAEAEDLTRETFLRSFRGIHSLRCGLTFSAYLYRLAVDLAFVRLRKKKHAEMSLGQPIESGDHEPLIAVPPV